MNKPDKNCLALQLSPQNRVKVPSPAAFFQVRPTYAPGPVPTFFQKGWSSLFFLLLRLLRINNAIILPLSSVSQLSADSSVPTPYPTFLFLVCEYLESEPMPGSWPQEHLGPRPTMWLWPSICVSESGLSTVLSPGLAVTISFKAVLLGNVVCPGEEAWRGAGTSAEKKG